ncbi:helix-turn-helix domain-containing protein [Mycobacterium sherrisii]|uniref:helix-turn-helix domain-containing protein n=1 Tax=Mycobacterium sherrisii TaxID=243061 RepID=UPI002DDD9BF7|nr:helix-turn-helix domain-containing protein [Mycobacterium sherrisii]MEC4763352.1 helix-turn-helix domain-containing protein [Mycobacterium sherrisii]
MQNEDAPLAHRALSGGDTEPDQVVVDYVEQTFDKTFGVRVKKAREERKWSQRKLAEELDPLGVKLDPSAVTRIERGSREVKLREAAAIAAALGVPLQDLAPPPSSTPREQFLSCIGSAGEQGLAARQALASMAMYYAMALHLVTHDPDLLPELAAELTGIEGDDIRHIQGETAAAIIEAITSRQSVAPLAYAHDASQAEQLTAIVNATISNLIGVEGNADSDA